jgi:hypothetical protein
MTSTDAFQFRGILDASSRLVVSLPQNNGSCSFLPSGHFWVFYYILFFIIILSWSSQNLLSLLMLFTASGSADKKDAFKCINDDASLLQDG